LVEDAAEALGSRYRGKHVGTLGQVGTFSFHATKTLTTGEGGMVITDDPKLFHRMTLYRNHGMSTRRYWHDVAGHNFRMTNLQAALGCAQLEMIDRILGERRRIDTAYGKRLKNAAGIRMQVRLDSVDPAMWVVAVRLDAECYPQGRDAVIAEMDGVNIETRPGFYTPDSMHHLYGHHPLAVSADVSGSVVCLPSSPVLRDQDIDRICDSLLALQRK
jgi:perosamine synthetase